MEIISIKGGCPTLNGKCHYKFPYFFEGFPKSSNVLSNLKTTYIGLGIHTSVKQCKSSLNSIKQCKHWKRLKQCIQRGASSISDGIFLHISSMYGVTSVQELRFPR